jgi:hypothetical protein
MFYQIALNPGIPPDSRLSPCVTRDRFTFNHLQNCLGSAPAGARSPKALSYERESFMNARAACAIGQQ